MVLYQSSNRQCPELERTSFTDAGTGSTQPSLSYPSFPRQFPLLHHRALHTSPKVLLFRFRSDQFGIDSSARGYHDSLYGSSSLVSRSPSISTSIANSECFQRWCRTRPVQCLNHWNRKPPKSRTRSTMTCPVLAIGSRQMKYLSPLSLSRRNPRPPSLLRLKRSTLPAPLLLDLLHPDHLSLNHLAANHHPSSFVEDPRSTLSTS